MSISSYNAKIMIKGTGVPDTYTQLVAVKNLPQIGGEPETLDTTTLSDLMKTSIPGIQAMEPMKFTANYDKAKYTEIKAFENVEKDYQIWYGNDGLGTD